MIWILLISLVIAGTINAFDKVRVVAYHDAQKATAAAKPDDVTDSVSGTILVVAPHGDDSSAGSVEAPFRTIQQAVNVARPGDLVFVRGGVYHETITIGVSGTAEQPIRVLAYENELPIIDGQYELPLGEPDGCNTRADPPICFVYRALVTITGSHVEFQGFRVVHSRGRGISVAGNRNQRTHHVKVLDCQVHEVRNAGIHVLYSDHVLIEGCDVFHAANFAPFSRSSSELNWPVVVNTPYSTHVTIRRNYIHENWGEGVAADIDSSNIVIENNIIYNNYALQVYIHRSREVFIRRNLIYHTNAESFRRGRDPSACIVLNNEEQRSGNTTVESVTIINNVIVGCIANIAIWGSQGTGARIQDVLIMHNTLVNARSNQQRRDAYAFQIAHSAEVRNIQISHNIVHQHDGPIGHAPESRHLIFNRNLWSRTPPSQLTGTDDLVVDPELVNPEAELIPGNVMLDWYKPTADSPAHTHAIGPYEYLDEAAGSSQSLYLPFVYRD